MFPLSIHNYFEFLALFFSIFFWKNIRHTPLKWFVPYLLCITIIDLIGRYYNKEIHRSNAWLYNISIPIEYLFFVSIFLSIYKNKAYQNLAKGFLILFSIYVFVKLLFTGITVFNTDTLLIGSFFMIFFSSLYLIELYNRPGIIVLHKEPPFWIAMGVLIFNAGEFSYDLLSKFLLTKLFLNNKLDKEATIFSSINKYLNLLLYCCISISFIWKKESTP